MDILRTDLEETNWKPGWYRRWVENYDEDEEILYFKDKYVFTIDVTNAITDSILRLAE